MPLRFRNPPALLVLFPAGYLLSRTYLQKTMQRKEIALDFILDNMEGVKDTAGFLELKQEPDLLMEIIFRQAS